MSMKELKAKIAVAVGKVKIDSLKCRYCKVVTVGGVEGQVRHLIACHADKIDVVRAKKLLNDE